MRLTKFSIFFLIVLCASVSFAQTADVSGRYDGTADVQTFGKLKITAVLRQSNEKVSGTFTTPLGEATIISGTFNDGNLALTIDAGGDDLLLNGKFSASGKIAGEISGAIANGKFELNRTGDAPPISDESVKLNLTKEQWREDLRFLADEFRNVTKTLLI